MSDASHQLELLKKLARQVSFNYGINWEDWKDEVAQDLLQRNEEMRSMNESLFVLLQKVDTDEEEYGRIVEDLLMCYIFDELIERKKQIENILV